MKITLERANESHIELISSLAEQIWKKHYPEIIGMQQVEYMLEKMYAFESLLQQMNEKKHEFFLVLNEKEKIGFISVHQDSASTYQLNKFYILQSNQKKGIGTQAFQLLMGEIKAAKEIRLTVNRHNFKSINFYFKNGFTIESVADFDIGDGYFMNDFIMVWKNLEM